MKRYVPVAISSLICIALTPIIASADMFGDINGDGAVNAVDASCILEYSAYAGAGGQLNLTAFMDYQSKGETPPMSITSLSDSSDSREYVERLSKTLDISDAYNLVFPEQYNALDAYMFKRSGNQFIIFHLSKDDVRLSEAKTGKVVIEPIASAYYRDKYESQSCCNGNYILLYEEIDEEVINAFMQ